MDGVWGSTKSGAGAGYLHLPSLEHYAPSSSLFSHCLRPLYIYIHTHIYTRVYTPVSFILIPLHLETRHGAAQQPRVGNAPFCPATTTTRPKPPSPQPTRHCNFVQSYFDVSLTLSPLANLKSPSILPGLPPYSLARNSTFSRLAATIVFEKPSMLFLRSFATRAILFLFSLFFLRIVAILIRPLLFSTK